MRRATPKDVWTGFFWPIAQGKDGASGHKAMLHELNIPDALIEWAKDEALRARWPRSWGHEAERLISMADGEPLDDSATHALLGRLEALVVAAVRAGRDDLLVDLDMFTAEWLGLRYTIELSDRTVTVGPGAQWSYDELRVLLAVRQPTEALASAEAAKDAVAAVFEGAHLTEISSFEDAEAQSECMGCGSTLDTVMLALNSGSQYCPPCWSRLTDDTPVDTKAKPQLRSG